MTADVHGRIAAAVTYWRGWVAGDTAAELCPEPLLRLMVAACDHADKVLARHALPSNVTYSATTVAAISPRCPGCRRTYPCPEMRDLADLWLGEGWDRP